MELNFLQEMEGHVVQEFFSLMGSVSVGLGNHTLLCLLCVQLDKRYHYITTVCGIQCGNMLHRIVAQEQQATYSMQPRCVVGCTPQVCVRALGDVHLMAKPPENTILRMNPHSQVMHDSSALRSVLEMPSPSVCLAVCNGEQPRSKANALRPGERALSKYASSSSCLSPQTGHKNAHKTL